ncbi:MAG: hypothetical protein Q9164_007019, partial [Protoblastenia rupestris]
ALFKPNTVVYTICFGTGKPRYVKYDFGEEKTTNNGVEYFYLECRYVDFDSTVFKETFIELAILKFRGTKKINFLDVFPFEYHPSKDEIKANLVECAEFAVVDIVDISWNPAAFAQLAIPSKQKEVIQAHAEAHISRGSNYTFDSFVIKNIVSTAHALATRKGTRVTIAHLEVAIAAGEDFECDFKGAGQVGNRSSIPRDALITRIQDACSPFYAILRNTETRDTVKPRAGPPPKIQITLETRSGNKTVTKVSGVEIFGVEPRLLAEELQRSCASSTSVGQLVGSSPRNPVMEVLVQGPQREAVIKTLERRGVRREWVEVLDKTKTGKGRG